MEKENYTKAYDVVFTKLKTDKDLYYAWQSNIAMAFVDKLYWAGYRFPSMNEIANEAAKNFLNLLLKKITDNRQTSHNSDYAKFRNKKDNV